MYHTIPFFLPTVSQIKEERTKNHTHNLCILCESAKYCRSQSTIQTKVKSFQLRRQCNSVRRESVIYMRYVRVDTASLLVFQLLSYFQDFQDSASFYPLRQTIVFLNCSLPRPEEKWQKLLDHKLMFGVRVVGVWTRWAGA